MSAHIDHTNIRALLGTREGMAELMANLTEPEFAELIDAMRIIASSEMPVSRSYAVADMRKTLNTAAERVALFHADARAFHTRQRVHTAYAQGATP
jgi:hypothetical protein